MKFKPKASDYVVFVGFLFFVTAHMTTYYIINSYQTVAEKLDIATEIVYQFEGNPLARIMFQLDNFKYIYSFIIMPAILFGFYSIVRRKDDTTTMAFALAFLMAGLLNAVNDLTVLFGFLATL